MTFNTKPRENPHFYGRRTEENTRRRLADAGPERGVPETQRKSAKDPCHFQRVALFPAGRPLAGPRRSAEILGL